MQLLLQAHAAVNIGNEVGAAQQCVFYIVRVSLVFGCMGAFSTSQKCLQFCVT